MLTRLSPMGIYKLQLLGGCPGILERVWKQAGARRPGPRSSPLNSGPGVACLARYAPLNVSTPPAKQPFPCMKLGFFCWKRLAVRNGRFWPERLAICSVILKKIALQVPCAVSVALPQLRHRFGRLRRPEWLSPLNNCLSRAATSRCLESVCRVTLVVVA